VRLRLMQWTEKNNNTPFSSIVESASAKFSLVSTGSLPLCSWSFVMQSCYISDEYRQMTRSTFLWINFRVDAEVMPAAGGRARGF
jgi:hypothetical protein